MGVHVAQMTSIDGMHACFEAVTGNAARLMGLEGYGIQRGCHADLVVLQAGGVVEAVRLKATRLFVLRRGRVVSRMAPAEAMLSLEGRPERTGFAISAP
jgi:cytosine deaminase